MSGDYLVRGTNLAALFSLTVHRGDGMCMLAMDWKSGQPPADFVGFAIEFKPPGKDRFYAVNNRLCFEGRERPTPPGAAAAQYPSTEAPLQTFRWVHFPRDADQPQAFHYRVTPVFMGENDTLSNGEAQAAELVLQRETWPGKVDVCFTRGYVSSQAFADKFGGADGLKQLIPTKADDGLAFVPSHPKSAFAYDWMGFDARDRILALLDAAKADGAQVRVVAYELNLPEMVARLELLGPKLKIIIDDSAHKAEPHSAESLAADRLTAAGAQVMRQHMGQLQHNKMIIVDGPTVQSVVCGSTNFSWRGFYVQANNAVVLKGAGVVAMQLEAFEAYWAGSRTFKKSPVTLWRKLPIAGIDAEIAMSPRSEAKALLASIGQDVGRAQSSLFFSLAFLSQTGGEVSDAVEAVVHNPAVFAFGISDKRTGILVTNADGNADPVYSAALSGKLPEPFRSESAGGGGVKMHHKFVVVDFDKPSARVYTGSFNFSDTADTKNGENLLLFRDRRIATAYMVEAVRIFDSYRFRVKQAQQKAEARADPAAPKRISLKKPPKPGEQAWWLRFYTEPNKIRDRVLFAGVQG